MLKSNVVFLLAFLTLFFASCTLEEIDRCQDEGLVECLGDNHGPIYRICLDGLWREQSCDVLVPYCIEGKCAMCLEGQVACVEGIPENYNFCKQGAWISAECATGRICVAGKCEADAHVCERNEDSCLDEKNQRHCIQGIAPVLTVCQGEALCVGEQCMCGDAPSCSGHSDNCVSGVCLCGDSLPCEGITDTCVDGECLCGTNPACADNSNICLEGLCMCGSAASCSGNSNRCVEGLCACGNDPSCSYNSDSCVRGQCFCGVRVACSGSSDQCVKGYVAVDLVQSLVQAFTTSAKGIDASAPVM